MCEKVRVRFAPSPTGDLHIGGIRTALFNWLFAKKKNGTFILRIEDTDEVRSTKESVKIILNTMKWLKLNWNEGPNYQTERKKCGIYKKYADELVTKGFAYPCYCTQEEINEMRQKAQISKLPPKYNGKCRYLTIEDSMKKALKSQNSILRFRMPDDGIVVLDDLIRGKIRFSNSLLDDFVIMKANDMPTYNFACVIDDHLMNITHVLRGDDHISNTPRQIHIYNALNWKIPKFAHMPMILGTDGTRLSKRHGHTSVLDYRKDGYLQDALINYIALLGWSTENSQQIFTVEELIKNFSIERSGKSSATFNLGKLLWLNGEKIRSKTSGELFKLFIDWIKYTNNEKLIEGWDIDLLRKAIFLEREKIKLLKDIPFLVDFFFIKDIEYQKDVVNDILLSDKSKENAKFVLTESVMRLKHYDDFSASVLEKYARNLAIEKNIKTKQVFHPIRVAISGRIQGPSLFHMMELMGKNEVIRRINVAITKFY
ncbi:MAG: glutamate--tRNA ligase [Endomicrobium sp.]|jgi:glutamyl-tRNA synthetase|nr:glutamate--tRNA ligase [Endomicrobium sp.]